MDAEVFSSQRAAGARRRALLLSLICPGAGQVYCGRYSAAAVVFLLRIVVPLLPALVVFSSRINACVPAVSSVLVFSGIHILSCADAWRHGGDASGKRRHSSVITGLCFSGLAASVLSCVIFFQLFPVKKLNDALMYPTYFRGEYLLCSARSAASYLPGDEVLYLKDGKLVSGRIAAMEEGDIVDLVSGRVSVNTDSFEQAAAGETEKPGNEHFYREKGKGGWYTVYRYPKKAGETAVSLTVEKNFAVIVPDNRIDGAPASVPLSSICYRIDAVLPLSGERVLPAAVFYGVKTND